MSRRTRFASWILAAFAFTNVACGGAAEPPAMAAMAPMAPMEAAPADAPAAAPQAAQASGAAPRVAPAQPSPPPPTARADGRGASTSPGAAPAKGKEAAPSDTRAALVVYTGGLAMVTESGKIPESIDKIIDVAEGLGGGLMGRRDDGVDIRVPSQHFRTALKELEHVATVTGRSVKAEDVTEQVHDLEVRLSNLKATQKRLQEFLVRAQNVNDALTVERELERVAVEIDTIEGKVTFLRNRASFSQISVSLREKPKDTPIVASGPAKVAPADGPRLPVPWLETLGIEPLLSLKKN